jgi:hypothetical protein
VRIETRCSDLAHFEIAPNAWSGIVSIFAHVPPDLRRAVHRRVVDGLRPGGVLILEAYTPEQLRFGTGGPPVAELTMDLATLEVELAGLVFEVAREREREVFEGRYHRDAVMSCRSSGASRPTTDRRGTRLHRVATAALDTAAPAIPAPSTSPAPSRASASTAPRAAFVSCECRRAGSASRSP